MGNGNGNPDDDLQSRSGILANGDSAQEIRDIMQTCKMLLYFQEGQVKTYTVVINSQADGSSNDPDLSKGASRGLNGFLSDFEKMVHWLNYRPECRVSLFLAHNKQVPLTHCNWTIVCLLSLMRMVPLVHQ